MSYYTRFFCIAFLLVFMTGFGLETQAAKIKYTFIGESGRGGAPATEILSTNPCAHLGDGYVDTKKSGCCLITNVHGDFCCTQMSGNCYLETAGDCPVYTNCDPSSATPICEPGVGCVQCTSDKDCAKTENCNKTTNNCEPKTCGANEIVDAVSGDCICNNANGYYGSTGSCTYCNLTVAYWNGSACVCQADDKNWTGSACVCKPGLAVLSNGTCCGADEVNASEHCCPTTQPKWVNNHCGCTDAADCSNAQECHATNKVCITPNCGYKISDGAGGCVCPTDRPFDTGTACIECPAESTIPAGLYWKTCCEAGERWSFNDNEGSGSCCTEGKHWSCDASGDGCQCCRAGFEFNYGENGCLKTDCARTCGDSWDCDGGKGVCETEGNASRGCCVGGCPAGTEFMGEDAGCCTAERKMYGYDEMGHGDSGCCPEGMRWTYDAGNSVGGCCEPNTTYSYADNGCIFYCPTERSVPNNSAYDRILSKNVECCPEEEKWSCDGSFDYLCACCPNGTSYSWTDGKKCVTCPSTRKVPNNNAYDNMSGNNITCCPAGKVWLSDATNKSQGACCESNTTYSYSQNECITCPADRQTGGMHDDTGRAVNGCCPADKRWSTDASGGSCCEIGEVFVYDYGCYCAPGSACCACFYDGDCGASQYCDGCACRCSPENRIPEGHSDSITGESVCCPGNKTWTWNSDYNTDNSVGACCSGGRRYSANSRACIKSSGDDGWGDGGWDGPGGGEECDDGICESNGGDWIDPDNDGLYSCPSGDCDGPPPGGWDNLDPWDPWVDGGPDPDNDRDDSGIDG